MVEGADGNLGGEALMMGGIDSCDSRYIGAQCSCIKNRKKIKGPVYQKDASHCTSYCEGAC